jgi:hypothetical protein
MLAVAMMTGSLALLPFAQPGALGVVACLNYELVGSAGATLLLITMFSEVPAQVPPDTIARVMAVSSMAAEGGTLLGALLGGTLGMSLGIPFTLGGSFLLALTLNALLVSWLGKRSRPLRDGQIAKS